MDTGSEDVDAMTAEEVAAALRVSPFTLRGWRTKRRGPKFFYLSGNQGVRYRKADLEAWLNQQAA